MAQKNDRHAQVKWALFMHFIAHLLCIIDEEGVKPANKGTELEMQDLKEGKVKRKCLASKKKKYAL
jgi:hypothetical protein